jgi:8-oxo-dGTP diphosphatase
MSDTFHGAKIALLCGDRLIAYRRDHTPGIPNPGLWDLPGGGREGDETPEACALREVEEEFDLRLDPASIHWRRRYPSIDHPGHQGWFLAAFITAADVDAVRFGLEGERWELMPIADFLVREDAVPALRDRLADYLIGRAPA